MAEQTNRPKAQCAHAHAPKSMSALEDADLMPHCADTVVHDSVLSDVRTIFPSDEHLYALADLYKVFGDSTRIRILYALFEAELCVCDIAALLGMTISAISHQLRVLKQAKLVKYRRDGKTVFYSLADDHVRTILGQGMEHVEE